MYFVRHENNLGLVAELRALTLPDAPALSEEELTGSQWWIARNHRGFPVGYGGIAQDADREKTAVLVSAGVLEAHRGNGLQLRLIRARVSSARRGGFVRVITYTLNSNHPSMRNLARAGFTPAKIWGDNGYLDWERTL